MIYKDATTAELQYELRTVRDELDGLYVELDEIADEWDNLPCYVEANQVDTRNSILTEEINLANVENELLRRFARR